MVKPEKDRALQIAQVCAILPMVVGTAVFVLWLITRHDMFVAAGMSVVIAGGFMFVVGAGALLRSGTRLPVPIGGTGRRTYLLWALLLLFNFPLALGYFTAFYTISTRWVVELHNETGQVLDEIWLVEGPLGSQPIAGDADRDLMDDVPPGSVGKVSLWLDGGGALVLHGRVGAAEVEETVDGYTSCIGGKIVITVHADRTVSAQTEYE